MQSSKLIKRRLLTSVPASWRVDNFDGTSFEVDFQFCFSYREVAKIEERCGEEEWFLNAKFWKDINKARVFPVVVWGAVIHNHPEYDDDEGLSAISEYLTGLDTDTTAKITLALAKAFIPLLPINLRGEFEESVRKMEAGEALPEPEKSNTPNPQKAEIETSSGNSGQSADTISASATTNSAA